MILAEQKQRFSASGRSDGWCRKGDGRQLFGLGVEGDYVFSWEKNVTLMDGKYSREVLVNLYAALLEQAGGGGA